MQLSNSAGPADRLCVLARDLDEIEQRFLENQESDTLTKLARDFIEGRLRRGVSPDAFAVATVSMPEADGSRVRLWDPATAWQTGDRGLFAVPITRGGLRAFSPRVGEVVRVYGNGRGLLVRIDGFAGSRVYGTAPHGRFNGDVTEWRKSVEDLVEFLADRTRGCAYAPEGTGEDEDLDTGAWVDYVLWLHGEGIVTLLLDAMRQDARFVSLEGRWFLRSLAAVPDRVQLERLAGAFLMASDHPWAVDEMLQWLPSPAPTGDAGRFGLALALFGQPDLFVNLGTDTWPRWALAGPPTGTFTARYAAFDPETLDVLCEPGESLTPEAVERLWALGLLASVVAR